MKKTIFLLFFLTLSVPAQAQKTQPAVCPITDKPCLLQDLERAVAKIDKESWRDKSYRELAKAYTYEGLEDRAIALIGRIQNPDTQALTIRGIGFAAADRTWTKDRYDTLFQKLTSQAQTISHAPSYGIALTYIAMAQAFAGDDAGATKTAAAMENDALRHKAFGESAEIQAERGDYAAAMASIAHIDSLPFRNKAYNTVSKIFSKQGLLQNAYDTALKIENPYLKAQALQSLINYGNPEEETGRNEE